MQAIRICWSRSALYRGMLIAVLAFSLVRLAFQAYLIADPESENFPGDIGIYLEAAQHFIARQPLYPQGAIKVAEIYQYAPSFALAFVVFLKMPLVLAAALHTGAHVIAYWLIYVLWLRIFRQLGQVRAEEMMAWTAPVWLLFSAFWSDLGYLNVYIFMALLATLLVEAVLNEHLGGSLLWLSLILQTKPQWAFVTLLPLLLGRFRFFIKLVGFAVVSYLALAGLTGLAGGPGYVAREYVDQWRMLFSMQGGNFPWHLPGDRFLGYNHSITQAVVYVLGASPGAFRLATAIQLLLLLPLAAVCVRRLRSPIGGPAGQAPRLSLDLVFALYLGAFLTMSVIWELTLGIAVFTYLAATVEERWSRLLVWLVFLVYALLDLWRVVSYVALGDAAVAPGPFIVTDPAVYAPLVMIVLLLFYGLLVRRLWSSMEAKSAHGV